MATPTGADLAVFRERSFRTEMSVLGVQQHDKLAPVHRSAYFQSPHGAPPIQLLSPSPLTAILHVWAETVSASKLAKSGGTFITTDGSNMVLSPKSKAGRLWNKTPAMFNLQHALTDGKTAAAFQGFRQNAYVEYRIPRGKRYKFVLLSRVRRFPPSSTGVMDMAELALNLDRAGGEEGGPAGVRFSNGLRPWAMMNAMLVKWREGVAYAERVMVGHVHEDSWARAGPAMSYVRLG
ncbi:hypothetical protein B2J93_4428 [Marssonina coronariae]|uniref:Uncharacterized protein n=1 Tax=Diplocarpon coronariae TaxID=2795749 RepID=A0A218ZA19_9HELO|nr:hypothetical protein B2J93_4428 [Marssonina coronariae]